MLALTKHTMNQKILASGFWAKYKENMKIHKKSICIRSGQQIPVIRVIKPILINMTKRVASVILKLFSKIFKLNTQTTSAIKTNSKALKKKKSFGELENCISILRSKETSKKNLPTLGLQPLKISSFSRILKNIHTSSICSGCAALKYIPPHYAY